MTGPGGRSPTCTIFGRMLSTKERNNRGVSKVSDRWTVQKKVTEDHGIKLKVPVIYLPWGQKTKPRYACTPLLSPIQSDVCYMKASQNPLLYLFILCLSTDIMDPASFGLSVVSAADICVK